ncbi:MAG: amidohydrolase [Bryobacterales bacterium]|jgi:hippurate hydrolase|nr:amidohydrolase [Bryobacterales bacterium]
MDHRDTLIESIAREATSWRRELHQNPQTMYEETYAAGFVAARLTEWGIPHETGIGGTGVVATIEGQPTDGAPTIAFRADMDALDLTEETGLPWASKNPGKMHGCGHDGHTATVLALGRYLQQTKRFHGKVRLVFQPAEEGGRGAYRMVDEGLLSRFPFDEIYGFHNWPYLPKGEFSICSGFMLAASDSFELTLSGKGGHAAMPHVCTDVIVAGSHLVSAWQSLVSRSTDPQQAAVLSVTNFVAGTGAHNVLPRGASLSGTVRTYSPQLRDMMERRMAEMAHATASMFGMEASFTYHRITDPVWNHQDNVAYASQVVEKLFGSQRLKPFVPVMGGEDFGHFLEKRPGCFIALGQAEPDPASPHSQGVHTTRYDFNDEIIPMAVAYFAELAETRLAAR